jgi:hypothetical protein
MLAQQKATSRPNVASVFFPGDIYDAATELLQLGRIVALNLWRPAGEAASLTLFLVYMGHRRALFSLSLAKGHVPVTRIPYSTSYQSS